MDLESVACRRRRIIGPQLLDQPIARDDAIRLQEQDRQQRSLLGPAER
jgi:hypothetical protein